MPTPPRSRADAAPPVAPRGRGRSRQLDPGRIVAAALELVRAHGLAALTMRRLAATLSVDPAALYWHFDNKDALLHAVSEAAASELALAEPEGASWQERCLALCQAIRERLREHPELEGGATPGLGSFTARATASLARVVAEAGLREDALFYTAQGLLDVVSAVVRSEVSRSRSAQGDVRHFVGSLAEALPPDLAGSWRSLARQDAAASFDAYFDELLGTVVAGIETRARA